MRQLTQGQRRLIRWLESNDLNQRSIAKLLSISEPHLSQILSGDKTPSLALGARIERMIGIPLRAWADKWISGSDHDEPEIAVSGKRNKG